MDGLMGQPYMYKCIYLWSIWRRKKTHTL